MHLCVCCVTESVTWCGVWPPRNPSPGVVFGRQVENGAKEDVQSAAATPEVNGPSNDAAAAPAAAQDGKPAEDGVENSTGETVRTLLLVLRVWCGLGLVEGASYTSTHQQTFVSLTTTQFSKFCMVAREK